MARLFRTREARHRRNGLDGHSQAGEAEPHGDEQKPRRPRSSIWILALTAGDIAAWVRSDVLSGDAQVSIKGRGTVSDFDVAYGQKGKDAATKSPSGSPCSPCPGLAVENVSRETCGVPAVLRRSTMFPAAPSHFVRRRVKDAHMSLSSS